MNKISKCIIALACITVGLSTSACATTVRFLADYNLPSGTKFMSTDLGGLSGMNYDPASNQLLIISDDKGEHQAPRFYTFHVTLSPGHLDLIPTAFTTMLQVDGTAFPARTLDPEGIAIMDRDSIFASSEGFSGERIPRVNPAIFKLGIDGHFIASLPIPEKFLPNPDGPQTVGVYNNGAFETLTLSPDKNFLFTATEYPLVQDDTPADFDKPGKSRILRYFLNDAGSLSTKEFVYEVEVNFRPAGATAEDNFGNGISDMLALNDHELIAIERGGAIVDGKFITHVRLFKVTIDKTTTEISSLLSLQNVSVIPVKKELLLDLDAILPQLSPDRQSLDNIEGITFGPSLENGHKTLLLISDDNFSPTQRTQAIALELVE